MNENMKLIQGSQSPKSIRPTPPGPCDRCLAKPGWWFVIFVIRKDEKDPGREIQPGLRICNKCRKRGNFTLTEEGWKKLNLGPEFKMELTAIAFTEIDEKILHIAFSKEDPRLSRNP